MEPPMSVEEAGDAGVTAEPIREAPVRIPRSLEFRLYVSHFLSTWNSRLFEFAAVLFLADIFPGTLLFVSVYALARNGAAILFAQSMGSWIDVGNRLVVVRTSILGQRLAVAGSCAIFWVLEGLGSNSDKQLRSSLFACTVILACVEKLCAVANLVSVERDWVVVITEGNEPARRVLNARIRRIDLFCKLLGPLVISFIAIASTLVAVWATLAMTIISIVPEYTFITEASTLFVRQAISLFLKLTVVLFTGIQIYRRFPALRRTTSSVAEAESQPGPGTVPEARQPLGANLRSNLSHVVPVASLPFYLRHPAFLPSFSLSILYLTVLSFSGQMITYLISVGYSSLYVGVARTASTVLELSATWIAPRLMRRIGIVRGGIWSLCWQMACLAGGVSWFFADYRGTGTNSVASATGLVIGVALSRVGLWGYDLCAQNIVQDEVEFDHRGSFSMVEASFQNLFEMLSYVSTIIFSRPDQFQWPVVISLVAVYASGGLYAFFVRKRRGHLFHAPPCMGHKDAEPRGDA